MANPRRKTSDDAEEASPLLDLHLEESQTARKTSDTAAGQLFAEQLSGMTVKQVVLEALLTNLHKTQTFEEFTREILLSLTQAIPSEAAAILEADHAKKHFFFRSAVGYSSDVITQFTVPFGKGIVGHVAESREIMRAPNSHDSKLIQLKDLEKKVGFESRNMVAVPIFIRGKIYGVIELLNRRGESEYTVSDIEVLQYLSQHLAHAIEVRLVLNWIQHSKPQASGTGKQGAA